MFHNQITSRVQSGSTYTTFVSRLFSFVPKKFERIFQRFARTEEDALSWLEVETMLTANRDLLKPWTWYCCLLSFTFFLTFDVFDFLDFRDRSISEIC